MENHQLVVSKAAFAARLLRPDPTTVPRDEISAFHTLLERVLSHCSPTNVQICKAWLLRFVVLSSSRVGGLATYLEALAGSGSSQPTGSGVSPKRRRLHILYLLNDILHHCKYHLDTTAAFSTVTGSLQPHIVNLVGHAAAFDRQKNPRLRRRLDTLLDIWSEHKYFHPDLVSKLREVVISTAAVGFTPSVDDIADAEDKKVGKEEPWIMPAIHGDSSTPWYDLPAGCWLPHIIPNKTIPIRPADIKPVRVQPGPASPRLINAVKESIEYANRLYDSENPLDDVTKDLDALGQVVNGERYYGWSVEFCEKIKKDAEDSSTGSRSRSGSPYPKRRRYSDSPSDRSVSRSPPRRRPNQPELHRHPDPHPKAPYSEDPYTRQEQPTSHFPPPHHQPHYPPAPANSFPPPHNPNAQYSQPHMLPHAGYAQQPAGNYGSWPAPQHMSTMTFPHSGTGYSPSAFPPQYHHQPPPMPSSSTQGQGQGYAMPPGQYHFPPPYHGGQQGQQGGPWGPPQGDRV
ncbi:RNA polymerase II large subunit CTD [Penicillium sp. DV-2018c]|nr:RNA polymerase II large subunit CTD [Penicillium sp. DV-2018c]